MNRIQSKFEELKGQGRKALITFVTAGDPDLDATVELVKEMVKQGADIVELGIPYSDPVAEGPVIQAANTRALKNGIRIKDIMALAGNARRDVQVPLVFLLYYNCIFQYGADRFFEDCKKAGVDGVIIPDLPFEEQGEIKEYAQKNSVDIITLVSPASRERIEKIAAGAKGFLYCITSLGVTGVRGNFNTDFEEFFSYINKYAHIPTALGFGIATPDHVKKLKGYSDGLIVGSAIVREIADSKSTKEAVERVGRLVREMRTALDS